MTDLEKQTFVDRFAAAWAARDADAFLALWHPEGRLHYPFANRMLEGPMPAGGDKLDDHAINQADRKLNCVGCHIPIQRTGQSPADVGAHNLSFVWAPIFSDLLGEDGLHFLSIPLDPAANAGYVPARLTAGDYAGLIPYNQPVDTVGVSIVLAVSNLQPGSERYRNIANFVDAFFSGFQSLLQPGHHPKWRDVNIMAELPGWRRFPPAQQWLERSARVATAPDIESLKANFSHFMDERQQTAGGPPLSQQEKDQLFDQFKLWASERPGLWQRLEPQ